MRMTTRVVTILALCGIGFGALVGLAAFGSAENAIQEIDALVLGLFLIITSVSSAICFYILHRLAHG